jgi:hypothetical protein
MIWSFGFLSGIGAAHFFVFRGWGLLAFAVGVAGLAAGRGAR